MDYLKPNDYSRGHESGSRNERPKLSTKSSSLNNGVDMDYLKPNAYAGSSNSASELSSKTDRPRLSAKSSSFGGICGNGREGNTSINPSNPPHARGPKLTKANSLGGFQHQHSHNQQYLRRGNSATIHGNAQSGSSTQPLLANPTTFAPSTVSANHRHPAPSQWTSNTYARRSDNSQNNVRFSTSVQPQATTSWPVHDPTNQQQFYVISPHLPSELPSAAVQLSRYASATTCFADASVHGPSTDQQLSGLAQQQLYLNEVANYLQSEQPMVLVPSVGGPIANAFSPGTNGATAANLLHEWPNCRSASVSSGQYAAE